jgi:hypothetical protein
LCDTGKPDSAVGSCDSIEHTVTFVGVQAGEDHAADSGSVRYLIECGIDTVLSLVAPSRSLRHPSLGYGRQSYQDIGN